MKTIIKTAGAEEFFRRGREFAKQADQGKRIPPGRVIAFENPEDIARLISAGRLALFREVKACPGSITEISTRLHRDRSAVKRDIDELERAGLVVVDTKPSPGRGRKKEVRVVAQQVVLNAVVA
jgi:predicted transcriptional regulator